MEQLFKAPQLTPLDERILGEIDDMRAELSSVLRAPRRWQGTLRKSAQAKAIQGSNSIEGYSIADDDAVAAVDGDAPLNADAKTWAEIMGYRRMMSYILNVATDPKFMVNESVLCSMHFMMLEHELVKNPGRYRSGPIYVSGSRGKVYTAPEADRVPELMAALLSGSSNSSKSALVNAAIAHLNLVMIHPFRDGNGRMGRALQTLIMARDQVLEPAFSSIEEWLGANTPDYYSVLAVTGAGSWHSRRSTLPWVRFNLRAHHMQAQTVRRRFQEANRQWVTIDEQLIRYHLPERTADALFDALLGWRLTRPSYTERAKVDERTATRDLTKLTELELLSAHGQTKARYYTAGSQLLTARAQLRAERQPLNDPYPDLVAYLRAEEAALEVSKREESLF